MQLEADLASEILGTARIMLSLHYEFFDARCPSCDTVIAVVSGKEMSSKSRHSLIEDRYEITDIWPKGEAQMFACFLEVGRCHYCGKSYGFTSCNMLAVPFEERGAAEEIVFRHIGADQESYFRLSGNGFDGFASIASSTLGNVVCFRSGPFCLEDVDLEALADTDVVRKRSAGSSELWEKTTHILLQNWSEMRRIVNMSQGLHPVHAAERIATLCNTFAQPEMWLTETVSRIVKRHCDAAIVNSVTAEIVEATIPLLTAWHGIDSGRELAEVPAQGWYRK
ncbi:hypothetical protein [Ensifer sp. SL37]|uniref:hypothetical protein n=1 Tax=Ensifer sp. SL37 TaxID=2995137 RepID=UPI0022745B8E|nr:hypothetical protein [Ensifer sp. SL37]MCY1740995.1 hypothetical protein [Ensifer sp. SL37]